MLLSAGRVTLVPLRQHNPGRYKGWFSDPEVVRYSELRHTNGILKPYLGELFGIYVPKHIGNIGAQYDNNNRVADLSILIGEKDYWGQGYGLEAWGLMLSHLLESQRKVTAGTMAENIPMLRIFQKSGMETEGIRKRQFLLEGREVDMVMAAKFND